MTGELLGERMAVDLVSGVISGRLGRDPVGHITLEELGDTLLIQAICIEGSRRGVGAGSECVRLVREYAEAGPWRVLRAWAPPDLGLAVYFWSRMGLRPVFGEGPSGGIWFERAVARQPAG